MVASSGTPGSGKSKVISPHKPNLFGFQWFQGLQFSMQAVTNRKTKIFLTFLLDRKN